MLYGRAIGLAGLAIASALVLGVSIAAEFPAQEFEAAASVVAQAGQDRKAEAIDESLQEASRLLEQGIQQHRTSQYEAALQSWEAALKLYRKVKDGYGEAMALSNLGIAYYSLSQYDKAISYYQQALPIFKRVKDHNSEARALTNLGIAYYSLSQYDKAISYHQQALLLFQQIKDRNGEAGALMNLGIAYDALSQYNKAISYYQQALPLFQLAKDRYGEALALSNLGNSHRSLSQSGKAISYYQQALPLFQLFKDRNSEAKTLNSLGTAYLSLSQYDKAISYYQQALPLFQLFKDRNSEAGALNSLGTAYSLLSQYDKAISYYQQALPLFQQIKDRSGEAGLLSNLGVVAEEQKQPELAIIFYKQSVNVWESIRIGIRQLPKEQQATYTQSVEKTYHSLADLLLKQDRIMEALQVLDLLKVQELQDYLRDRNNNVLPEQKLPFLEPEPRILQQIETAIAAQTLSQQLNSPAIQTLSQQLKATAPAQNLTLSTYRDLQTRVQKLGKNIALFYPLILDDRLELVILTRDRPPIHKPVAITQKQLETEIQDFRKQLQGRSPLIKQPAQQLYQRLIQPIATELKTAGVDTLVYAPDSIMRYVPLAALHDGNQWLAERYQINYLTALALTPLEPDKNSNPRVLAGALTEKSQVTILGKTYDFPALQFTQPEVENLAKLLPNTTTLIDKTFNRDRLSTGASQSTILHLATHGMFVPDSPDQSIIVLGNGTSISLREIEQQWKFPNVSLVVLSACETAIGGKLGSGIEILGFGYQMQRAGSRASISSLWTVDDGGTQGFMNTFYTALKQGKTPAAAIQQTQQDFISGKVTSQDVQQFRASGGRYVEGGIPIDLTHPFYWAPFILIGNGL